MSEKSENNKSNKVGQADVGSVLKTTASKCLADKVAEELLIEDPKDKSKAMAILKEKDEDTQ